MTQQDWLRQIAAAYDAYAITTKTRDVLYRIGRLWSRYDVLHPSHDWLAQEARCCRKTVLRALAQARAVGLISWRPQRWLNRAGFRSGPNIYRPRLPPEGHFAAQTRQRLKKAAQEAPGGRPAAPQAAVVASGAEQHAARAALAMIAARREAQRAVECQAVVGRFARMLGGFGPGNAKRPRPHPA
jgi:DNA-binding transcriptional MocR family regulator